MGLSNDLVSQFVKITKDESSPVENSTVYGTVVIADGKTYVRFDGSDLLTPVSQTSAVENGERVVVTIKNHEAIITGNLSSPSVRTERVDNISGQITEMGVLIAEKVSVKDLEANYATIENLNVVNAEIDNLKTNKLDAYEASIKYATIEKLEADEAEISKLKTDKLDATAADIKFATIENLEATNAEINSVKANYATIGRLEVSEAKIEELDTKKLSVEDADIKYATIDFANINMAAVEKLFSESGIIKDLVVSDGKITGELVGVTIKGDLIEGNTIKADKLVVLGEDGLYYKLNANSLGEATASSDPKYQNGLDGSVIVANSITAEKISVDDLVAFDATIGGFHIGSHSLYSGTKTDPTSSINGIYMDDSGQISVGDGDNYFRYYKDESGIYKLDISSVNKIQDRIDEADKRIDDQRTEFKTMSDQIIALTEVKYITESELSTLKEEIASQFRLLPDFAEFNFDTVKELINNGDNGLKDQLLTWSRNIKISGDENDSAITIQTSDSVISLELDNTKGIVFKKDGAEMGSWDGNYFYSGNIVVRVNEKAQLGNFAYVPRSDGSLMFLKVGG